MESFQYNNQLSIENFQHFIRKMETPIKRLLKYLEDNGINDNQFTVDTGISVGWLGKAKKKPNASITEPVYQKIIRAYKKKNLDEIWLKTGKKSDTYVNNSLNGDDINIEKVIEENHNLKIANQMQEETIKKLQGDVSSLIEILKRLKNE